MTLGTLAAGASVACASLTVAELAGRRRRATRRIRPRRAGVGLTLLTEIGRRLGVAPAPEDLARRLAGAGAPTWLGAADVMAVRTGAALVALLAAAGPATALPGRLGPVAVVAASLSAAYAPDLWLRRRARTRGRTMAAEAPDVLDLMRVCIEAGRTPTAAMAEVGRRHPGLLGRELHRAARELALGHPHQHVLAQLADRCPIEEVATLAVTLRRAERHGAPLAPALTALAADARAARARAVREQAARAAPKIQLVVALLLVPAVMLLVGAALASAFDAS